MSKPGDINSVEPDFDPNKWAALRDDADAIQKIFETGTAHTTRAIDWYKSRKASKAFVSRALRFIAIVGGVLGALAPVVTAMVPDGNGAPVLRLQITNAGYLAVGIAAGALALDRFFGLSSGWIRYMGAMTALEKLRLEFTLDWARMMRTPPSPAPDVMVALERVIALRRALQQVIEDETKAWVTEFQTRMADLDKFIQETRTMAEATQREASKLLNGGIGLTITGSWDGVAEIWVDDALSAKASQPTTLAIGNVTAGLRKLEARYRKGTDKRPSKFVTVEAGKSADVSMDLS